MDTARWRRISDVLDEALELEPSAAEAFVAKACAGDAALEAEVLALLRADGRAKDFLATPAPLATGGVVGEAKAGDRVGAWQLERLLGEGGMGRVFLATRTVGGATQKGALKVLAWSMAPGARQRFVSEQRVLAGLDHPGIARFLDAGVDDDVPWLVMEVVEGAPLTTWGAGQPLEARLRRFLDVCDAVQAAHRQLVVHRDLKPSNVLVTAEGRVKLLDFGIARELDGDAAATRTESRVLTPEYAAPEQVSGGAVTTAIDVWGLGVLLCELLTGAVPWPRGTGSVFAVQQAVLSQEPPRVAPKLAGQVSSATARDLEGVVWKALQKAPERRYASVGALADDVRRVLAGEPVTAREHTRFSRALRFVARHRAASLTALAFVATLSGGAAATAWQAREARREAARAQAEAEAAKAARDFVVRLFTGVDPAFAKGRDLTAVELLSRAAARIDSELEGQAELQDALWREIASVDLQLGAYAEGEVLAKKLLARREAVYGPDDVRVAEALVLLADLVGDGGRPDDAEPLYTRALKSLRAHGDRPAQATVEAMRGLAWIARVRGDEEGAERQLLEALALARAETGPASEATKDVLSSLTRQCIERRQFDRAAPYAKETLALATALGGPESPSALVALYNLAIIESDTGQWSDAAEHLARLRPLQEKLLGKDHANTLLTLRMQARLASRLGRGDEADALLDEVVTRLRAQTKGEDTEAVAWALMQWDIVRRDKGLFDGSKAKEAQRILEARVGPTHPDVGWALSEQAQDAAARGALDEARTLATRAEALQRPAPGSHDVWHAETVDRLGRIVFLQGRRDEAVVLHRQALESLVALGAVDAVRWRAQWHLAEAEGGAAHLDALREAVAKLGALFPDGHPERSAAVLALVKGLRAASRLDEARTLLEEEVARASAWNPKHPGLAALLEARAR